MWEYLCVHNLKMIYKENFWFHVSAEPLLFSVSKKKSFFLFKYTILLHADLSI